jgi:1-acyl-sn-glycerol-3-phosphate acyltransferase
MFSHLGRIWRLLATGFCFLAFGIAAILARVLIFQVLPVFLPDPQRRQRWTRGFVRRSFRLLIAIMSALGIMTYEWRGLDRLQRQGLLVLANHPSFIDVVFLMAFIEGADCIVKASLARNPFTRSPMQSARYQFNDSGVHLVEDCIASVRSGSNLIVFPEGTRTRAGPQLTARMLHRGAANIAVRGQINVTPVSICIDPPTLGKGERWYQVPWRRWHIQLEVGADIKVAPILLAHANESIAARRLNELLVGQLFPADNFSPPQIPPRPTHADSTT